MRAKNQGAMKDAPRGMSINCGSTCRSRADSVKSGGAAMQQIADWLEKLGMSEYAQRFAENRIDFSVLPDLTDQDLEKLGVVLGDRRKVLRAIAELDRQEATAAAPAAARVPPSRPAPPSSSPTPGSRAATPRPQEAAGERRYLTVMFCDLVDSTGI